jgi:tetratricopeptide (TPR) repeat protein
MSIGESKPPPPLLEPMLSAAAYHRARGQLEEALDAYKKALMVAPDVEPAVLASIYAHIGAIKRAQDKTREAELNFEKALHAEPGHRRSLDALVEMATAEKDNTRARGYRRKIVNIVTDPLERADELSRIATTLADDLDDVRGAIEALEEARKLRAGDLMILRRLEELYSKVGAWPKVIEILGALCLEANDGKERARYRVLQADIARAGSKDDARAMQLLEAALEEDPGDPSALAKLVELRSERGEWRELEREYARLIDRHAERGRADRAWEFCKRLGALRRDKLEDAEGAIDAFTGALRCKPDDVEARAQLADLFAAHGDNLAAVRELEAAAAVMPRRRQTYRKLFELHTRAGRTDRAWLAAMALEELDAAEIDHEIIANQYRPEGMIRPAAALDDAAWEAFLRAPGYDGAVAEILRASAPAAIAAKLDAFRKAGKPELDPTRRQDPTSTASVVRTFAWASQVLGVMLPDLFVLDEVPGGIAAAQVTIPSTALGPTVVSGPTVQELAFLAARHLTYYRPEHYALVFFPTLSEITMLFLAAVTTVLSDLPVPASIEEPVARLRKDIADRADDDAKAALDDGVRRFEREGGRADLGGFLRSVELSACRAGLVVCADLAVAARILKDEQRAVGELTGGDRVSDLLVYCAEEKLPVLREWLGVAARPSMMPPALMATPSMPPPRDVS